LNQRTDSKAGAILRSAVILIGLSALWLQVFLIRELLVTFSGNELVIGIFLSNWLFLTAIGSFLSSRFGAQSQNPVLIFTILQLLIAVMFPVVLYLVRTVKYQIGIIPGEGIPLPVLFTVSFMLTLPVAFVVGFQFGYACRLIDSVSQHQEQAVSRTYVLESLGSMAGGLLLGQVFMLRFSSFTGAVIIALLNLLVAMLLLYRTEGMRAWRMVLSSLFILVTAAAIAGLPGELNLISRQHQWKDYDLLAEGNSVYGHATLLAYQGQLIMVSNGVPVATIPVSDPLRTEDLIHLPLLLHPNPGNVLLIGGAPGGPLDELVSHPLKSIDYVDLDPLLIELMEKNLPDTLLRSFDDPRLTMHFTDARYFLNNTRKRYDVILLNLPEPASLEINRFYTREFFEICRKRLTPSGIIGFTLPGSVSAMGPAMCRLNHAVISAAKKYFHYLNVYPDAYNLYICSTGELPQRTDTGLLEQRRHARGIQSHILSEFYLQVKADSLRFSGYSDQIKNCPVSSVNRDLKPVAVFYSLLHWNKMYAPLLADILLNLEEWGIMRLLMIPIIFTAVLFLFTRNSPRRTGISLIGAIGATGFVGMGMTVILVLQFQATFGYIYHWIGFLLAAFMAGLAAGSWWGSSRGTDTGIRTRFTWLETLLLV
jgi:spermidine synthase